MAWRMWNQTVWLFRARLLSRDCHSYPVWFYVFHCLGHVFVWVVWQCRQKPLIRMCSLVLCTFPVQLLRLLHGQKKGIIYKSTNQIHYLQILANLLNTMFTNNQQRTWKVREKVITGFTTQSHISGTCPCGTLSVCIREVIAMAGFTILWMVRWRILQARLTPNCKLRCRQQSQFDGSLWSDSFSFLFFFL